ncbi:DUF397 domain-containing protein [Micromonospora carbonacea]|uniref:DUF397 domain-containing protein n=1 Tax=Micromonospora carbonacea TaxID=47853 RepID=UPI003D9F04C9
MVAARAVRASGPRFRRSHGNLPGVVVVRESKDRTGPVLAFAPATWGAFLTRLAPAD